MFHLVFFYIAISGGKTADEWYNEGVYLGQSGKFTSDQHMMRH